MTIIQPNKNAYRLIASILWLILILVILAIGNIYFYNRNVGLKHVVNENRQEIQKQRVMNADYKNQFYQILDSQKIESLAKEKRLIPDKNPEYLET